MKSFNNLLIATFVFLCFSFFNTETLHAQLTFVNATGTTGQNSNISALFVTEDGTIYAGTGEVYKSIDGGNSFTLILPSTGQVRDIFVEGNNIYIATSTGLFVSTDGGNNFNQRTPTDGLGDDKVLGVYAVGNTVYATCEESNTPGFSISTDNGTSFTSYTSSIGYAHNEVRGVFVKNGIIYLATKGGVAVSTDGGVSFTSSTVGLGNTKTNDIVVTDDGTIYVAENSGLSISTDGGATFTSYGIAEGIPSATAYPEVQVVGSTIYLASTEGLVVSTDGGASFTTYNKTNANLNNDHMWSMFISGDAVYAGTKSGLSIANIHAWSVADIITDCEAEGMTYDVCYTANALDGVIGVDFDFSYPDELSPVSEDFITLKTAALAPVSDDASQIDMYDNTDVAGEVSVSLFFNASAPFDASWTGGGEFICFTFEMSDDWDGTAGTETITTNSLVESYETGIGNKSAAEAKLTILTMTGQIYVNGDLSTPLVNGENFNGTTEIMTTDENCESDDRWTQTFNTENEGEFSIGAAGSTNLKITRNTLENDLSIIGGADALRAVFIRLGLGAAPTVGELLSMDVNGDGFASAGDITNILRRSVGLIANFPMQDGEVASDWKFALATTMDELEAGAYDWKNVPVLPQCIAVPANPCAEVYEYDAILKGDLDNSWAATSSLKTAIDRSLVIDVENKAMLEMETTYRIPIYAKDSDSFFTLDLDLPFDPSKVSIEDVVLTELGASYEIQYVWNMPEEGRLMMASYTIQEIDTDQPLFEIVVKEDVSADAFGTGKSYFNGIESGVEVTGTAVGIEDILGGGHNLTAIESLHPNPASNTTMINYNAQLTGKLEISIMDLAGRKVFTQVIGQQGRVAIDLGNLQNGLYIVTLSEEGQLKGREKLMVAK